MTKPWALQASPQDQRYNSDHIPTDILIKVYVVFMILVKTVYSSLSSWYFNSSFSPETATFSLIDMARGPEPSSAQFAHVLKKGAMFRPKDKRWCHAPFV